MKIIRLLQQFVTWNVQNCPKLDNFFKRKLNLPKLIDFKPERIEQIKQKLLILKVSMAHINIMKA